MEKRKLKELFEIQPEKMSRIVKWTFALPIAYIAYLVIGLLIPNIPGFWTPISSLIRYFLLIICILIVSDKFLKFPLRLFISETGKFRASLFIKGFLIMLFALSATSYVWFLFDKKDFSFTFVGLESVKQWFVQLPMLVVAAFCEELVFRSYVSHFLSNGLTSSKKAIVIYSVVSGLLFCVAHFSNPEVEGSTACWALLFYFIFGFALMIFLFKTKGIEFSFGVHLANNLFCLVFLSYDNSVIQSFAVFTQYNSIGIGLIIQTVFCLLICTFC